MHITSRPYHKSTELQGAALMKHRSQLQTNRDMCSSASIEEFRRFLSAEEAVQICNQFHTSQWQQGCQIMWSGVPRDVVQHWADRNGMQTLTTAMGPLMDNTQPQCRRPQRPNKQWSRYMKGACAMFAYHIAQDGGVVTVLSPPPPHIYNPYGGSNYQTVEEPVLKGKMGPKVARIDVVHPTVVGADEFRYQLWPHDQTRIWEERFGHPAVDLHWRHVTPRQYLTLA
ncbi:hypothetical protein N7456_007079 [Penicillium angulare]|uniref:Uncharacterized protein n=2 Tax=Penicillium angulare TaxID=116970 RepID=A0A9W9KDI3_9EURO|nr:hypothetical protein N7456_006829 [Penicillium angulare]KAJ5101027.1 hypothetical protein N7456_007079 [Penicillium angulare]